MNETEYPTAKNNKSDMKTLAEDIDTELCRIYKDVEADKYKALHDLVENEDVTGNYLKNKTLPEQKGGLLKKNGSKKKKGEKKKGRKTKRKTYTKKKKGNSKKHKKKTKVKRTTRKR